MGKLKTGVTYLSKNYNVNEVKRLVACHLKFGINLDHMPYIGMLAKSKKFNHLLNCLDVEKWEDKFGRSYNFVVLDTVGFAYCAPDDIFDGDLGKKIALTRAQSEAFKITTYFYNRCADILFEASQRYDILVDNCKESTHSCNNHIVELTENN